MLNAIIGNNLVNSIYVMNRLLEVVQDSNTEFELRIKIGDLHRLHAKVIGEILPESTQEFKDAIDALQALTKKAEEAKVDLDKVEETITEAAEAIGKISILLANVVAVAAAPRINPLTVIGRLMRARSDHDLRMVRYSLRRDTQLLAMPPESHIEFETMPESHLEKKAPLFLIEEVLHGVELTPEKLVITVATGGCTEEGDFRFDVNKMASPYMVTVYRIVSDDCEGKFEPIQISYSRKELGLEGGVEFILRNKIGNTSQHRLNS